MKDLQKRSNRLSKVEPNLFLRNWPYLVIFFVSLAFFYPVWLQNKVPLPADALVGAHVPWTELKWKDYPAGVPIKNQEITDAISQFYPWRSLVAEFLRNGEAPLWNQYMFSGAPLLATWHSAALYPLNFFYLIFSDINAWTFLIFFQIFLSAFWMYLFLSNLGLQKVASLFGAFTFSFSGYMIAWLEFATGGQAALWLPLLLLVELKLVKSSNFIWVTLISIIFFFIYTAGDFQVPFYITLTYFLFAFYQIFYVNKGARKRGILLLRTVGGWILGILFSLPQILPTVELFRSSVRVDDPYIKEYFYGLMHWEKIVNFIWPDFFGNIVTRNYWGKFGYHEYLSYIGVIPLVFIAYSFFNKKDKVEKFFWIILFLALIFLFPTPFAFLPYKLKIPGLGTSSASRIIFLVDFCLSVLASFGLSAWIKYKNRKIFKVVVSCLLITSGVALGLSISVYKMGSFQPTVVPAMLNNLKVALKNMIPATLILFAFLAVIQLSFVFSNNFKSVKDFVFKLAIFTLFFITLFDLLRFAWKNTPFSPNEFVFPGTRIIDYLKRQDKPFRIAGGIPLNYFMQYGLSSAEGYDPIYPKENSEWYSLVNSGNLTALSGRYGLIHDYASPLINYANIKYVIDYKKDFLGAIKEDGNFYKGIEAPFYKQVYSEGRIKVFENTKVLPKVWVTRRLQVATMPEDYIRYLKEGEKVVVLDNEPGVKFNADEIDFSVENFEQKFNSIEFNLYSSKDAYLFLSESYNPGWQAYVDNKEVDIKKANYIYQAITINEGDHKVEFLYNPRSFRMGVTLSIITLLGLSGYGVYTLAKNVSKK